MINVIKNTKQGGKAIGQELKEQDVILDVYILLSIGTGQGYGREHTEHGESEEEHDEIAGVELKLLLDCSDRVGASCYFLHHFSMEVIIVFIWISNNHMHDGKTDNRPTSYFDLRI